MLFDGWDDYKNGVMRTDVLLRTHLCGSHHMADRSINVELSLYGPFYLVPEWLYFRREHAELTTPLSVRERCVALDQRWANRLRHPIVRLYTEYFWSYIAAIHQAPLDMGGTPRMLSGLRIVADETSTPPSWTGPSAGRGCQCVVDIGCDPGDPHRLARGGTGAEKTVKERRMGLRPARVGLSRPVRQWQYRQRRVPGSSNPLLGCRASGRVRGRDVRRRPQDVRDRYHVPATPFLWYAGTASGITGQRPQGAVQGG